MAHLFEQMYVDEIDFDALTVEKLIDLVFTEIVYRKIQQLEEKTLAKRDQTDGNQWTRFRECFKMLDNEERWISYAERALELLNHDVMWRAVVDRAVARTLIGGVFIHIFMFCPTSFFSN